MDGINVDFGRQRGRHFGVVTGGRGIGRAWLAFGSSILLAGCFAETSGSPKPPVDFGGVDSPLLGCPDVVGEYAWPPVAGEHSGRMATNREPWDRGIPVPVGRGEMQIWVSDEDGRVTLHSRRVNRAANVRDILAREWSYAEYASDTYDCRGGMLVVTPVDLGEDKDYGGTGIRRGFSLARLDDGGLAVGVLTIAYGNRDHLFGWGDVRVGEYDAPDRHYWRWSKLARTGDGRVEPAPMDAGAR